ncbi:MAG TPA: zinc ribbon domain-containing protein [Pyrinomonadaceae bacterium]|nr:zinc ribbon domain-containing protein [Pyrinomonadaceae bacterium]
MLCPNCGTKTKTEHRFCRNCGMNLEPVSKALAEHLSAGGAPAARAAGRGAAPEAMGCLFAGVVVILVGVLLTAFMPGKAFKFVGVASAVIGLIAVLVSALSSLHPTKGVGAEAPASALDDAAPNTGPLLREQSFEPARASITDHTTELLHAEVKDRKPRQES